MAIHHRNAKGLQLSHTQEAHTYSDHWDRHLKVDWDLTVFSLSLRRGKLQFCVVWNTAPQSALIVRGKKNHAKLSSDKISSSYWGSQYSWGLNRLLSVTSSGPKLKLWNRKVGDCKKSFIWPRRERKKLVMTFFLFFFLLIKHNRYTMKPRKLFKTVQAF